MVECVNADALERRPGYKRLHTLNDLYELRLIRPAWLAWATSGSLSRE